MRCCAFASAVFLMALCGCQGQQRQPSAKTACADSQALATLVEIFPHVRIDVSAGLIEIDARIATDVHDPQTPDVYLELIACSTDTREHEALVVTSVQPGHVHAALLMLGLEPGTPGRFVIDGGSLRAIAPTGPSVEVFFRLEHCDTLISPESWVEVLPDREVLEPQRWVFAGSRIRHIGGRERYMADIEGTIIGLTTFGTEIIAPTAMHHPDSIIEEPSFLARSSEMPRFGVPVTIILRAIVDRSEP